MVIADQLCKKQQTLASFFSTELWVEFWTNMVVGGKLYPQITSYEKILLLKHFQTLAQFVLGMQNMFHKWHAFEYEYKFGQSKSTSSI